MDGNKKIINVFFAGLIALALTACMVQPHGYGGLYVDTENTVSDTIRDDKKMVNTEAKADSIRRMKRKSSDSIHHQKVEELLTSISDSVQQMRYQITEIQKQQSIITDSSYVWSEHQVFKRKDSLQTVKSFRTPSQIKTDTLNTQQIQNNTLKKSVNTDTVTNRIETQTVKKANSQSNQFTQVRNDSISASNFQNEVKKSSNQKSDTLNNATTGQNFNNDDSLRASNNSTQMLQTNNDTIVPIRRQINELRNSDTVMTDTIFVARETGKSSLAENQHTDFQNQQQLKAKDDQIQRLQNQLNAQQNSNTRRPRQSFIFRDRSRRQPSNNQQSDKLSMQLIQEQNDTIQNLRSQLRNLQLEPQKRDSLNLEQQKTTGALRDTLKVFNTRLLDLENDTSQVEASSALAKLNERDAALNKKIDTTLMVVFYGKGQIKPLEEAEMFNQMKELSSNKNIKNILLSGYTDSSGNAKINKEITNKRLNYLSENISPWISKEKIFFQNFGDVFSSDQMINDERRIEIRILTE